MKQFILGSKPDKDNIVRLEGKDYRYLVRVRRLAVGEYFPALLPGGEETTVQVISIDKSTLVGKCNLPQIFTQRHRGLEVTEGEKEERFSPNPPSVPLYSPCLCVNSYEKIPPIILFQALPKSDKMDLIVRQAAESGITEIVPFVSEFSVAKANAGGQKFLRWERIIKEARQQSGSRIETALSQPLTTDGLFDYWNELKKEGALGFLFHHLGLEQKSLHGYLSNNPKIVALAIGPEGGFSDKEVFCFLEHGFKPLTLGNTVLRTETAALYCTAAVRILLLERNSWEPKQPYLTK